MRKRETRRRWMRGMMQGGLATVLALGGCLLDPRDPEPPGSGSNIPYENPTSPEVVLQNIRAGFAGKSVSNYERSLYGTLDQPFEMVPDPADASIIGGGFFDGWTVGDERSAVGAILGTEGEVSFVWTDQGTPNSVPGGDPSQVYFEDLGYRMSFETDTADTTLSGRVDLYLREDSGLYSVYAWVDKRDGSGNATLGLQRAKGAVNWGARRALPASVER